MLSRLCPRSNPATFVTATTARVIPAVMAASAMALLAMAPPNAADAQAPKVGSWADVKIPEAWKTGAGGHYVQGTFDLWYRCGVAVPENWKGRQVQMFVEGVDDARAVYVNGKQIGQLGEFPPRYRSGLGASRRFDVPPNALRYGDDNWIAIHVHHREGRSGFNVAAPVLFAGSDAIRLEGTWQLRVGGDLDWSKQDAIPQAIRFADRITADLAERTLRKLDDDGPLLPQQTLARMKIPDDLAVDVCLSEPTIAQPLAIRFDARGRLWLMEYRQYPQPAGLKPVSRDKYLRTVYDKVPQPPPHRVPGRDRISIHEDTDGDGVYDKHSVFLDGLNITTSFAIGRGGVWVLNPPYLLFYPDHDRDDHPDGDPVVHLEGFGLEDTHSVVNSLCFGPDGWLYASQGSTVSGHVKCPGSSEPPVQSMGQLIWRYHPELRKYEIYAEGGGNAFGVEIDAQGRVFSGHNGGNTRGFHYVQGGYFQKGFAKHGALSNPYAYGYFPFMPHEAVPRFTHSFVVYDSTELPQRYHQALFAVAPLQSEVVISERRARGSTFGTHDIGRAFVSSDTWVRPVAAALGPDGAVYVSDFYEQRIDHAAHFQGRVDRTNGRVYRIRAAGRKPNVASLPDLEALSSRELLSYLNHHNRTVRRIALRIIGDRHDPAIAEMLRESLPSLAGQPALDALWALNLSGGLDDPMSLELLSHPDPFVRLWTIRLAADDRVVSHELAQAVAERAVREQNIEVRNQMACSARRLPAAQALPALVALLRHDADLQDPYQPLCLWWALETKVTQSPDAVVSTLRNAELWQQPLVREFILERLMRRFAQSGTRADLLRCATLLGLAPDTAAKKKLMSGFEAAMQGRSLAAPPNELVSAIAAAGGLSLELRLRQGDTNATKTALAKIRHPKTSNDDAARLIDIVGQVRPVGAETTLLELVQDRQTASQRRQAALAALESYNSAQVGATVLKNLSLFDDESRESAFALLASRADWTRQLLSAVSKGQIKPDAVPERFLKRALLHRNEAITKSIHDVWGDLQGATTEQMYRQIAEYQRVVLAADGNPYAGKRIFDNTCAKCHRLFDEGGQIGPDLTPYQRQDLGRILLNVINPSAEIREGFETHLLLTDDGRTLSGFIEDQDNQVVILKDAEGRRHIIEKAGIEEMAMMKTSVMPEKLLDRMTPEQVRDLFAYLRASQPLP